MVANSDEASLARPLLPSCCAPWFLTGQRPNRSWPLVWGGDLCSNLSTVEVKVKVAQLCLTLCDPMDYIVYGILQARILEWVAFPFSTGSSRPRDGTQVSRIAAGFFTSRATREVLSAVESHSKQ